MQYKLAYIAFLISSFSLRSHHLPCPTRCVAVVILPTVRAAVGTGLFACPLAQDNAGVDSIVKRRVAAFPLASLFALMAFACHVASYFIGFIGMITIR